MARSLFWLSDEAWKTLEPHLPHGKPGKPRVDLWGACPLGRGRTCRGRGCVAGSISVMPKRVRKRIRRKSVGEHESGGDVSARRSFSCGRSSGKSLYHHPFVTKR
jgi:hypothetical protein